MLLLHSDLHFGWFLIVARRGDGCHLKESWLSSLFSSLLSNSIGSDFVWKGAFFSGVHGRSSLLIMVTQGLRLMETQPWHVLLTSLSQHLRVWRLEASLTLHTATVGHREFCAGLERWLSHSAHNQKHKRVIGNPTLKETEKGNSALCSLGRIQMFMSSTNTLLTFLVIAHSLWRQDRLGRYHLSCLF